MARCILLLLFSSALLPASPGARSEDPYPWSSHPLETVIRSRNEREVNATLSFCAERLDPEKYARVIRAFGTVARFLNNRRGWSDPAANFAAVDGMTLRELLRQAERAERTGVLRLPSQRSIGRLTLPLAPKQG